MPDVLRREIHIALSQHDPFVGVLVGSDPEVELAADDDAELLVAVMTVNERAFRTTVDAPETELQLFAGYDAATEAGATSVDELVVVEEMAVLARHVHLGGPSPRRLE